MSNNDELPSELEQVNAHDQVWEHLKVFGKNALMGFPPLQAYKVGAPVPQPFIRVYPIVDGKVGSHAMLVEYSDLLRAKHHPETLVDKNGERLVRRDYSGGEAARMAGSVNKRPDPKPVHIAWPERKGETEAPDAEDAVDLDKRGTVAFVVRRGPRDRKHSHYFKECPFDQVDVYRVLKMFEVTDPCIQHAIKKLLAAGGRGAKDENKDVSEAVDSLHRWQEMRREESQAPSAYMGFVRNTVSQVADSLGIPYEALAEEYEDLEKRASELAAGQCVHPKGIVGDDGGSATCPLTGTRDASSPLDPPPFDAHRARSLLHGYNEAIEEATRHVIHMVDQIARSQSIAQTAAEASAAIKSFGEVAHAVVNPEAACANAIISIYTAHGIDVMRAFLKEHTGDPDWHPGNKPEPLVEGVRVAAMKFLQDGADG